ncbi:GTPase HflX [Aliikangiella sp. IMCC44359]|uniref:GTPase HflX n=1 Tax=Aliikangiella sp. IMCC44359 TaxID=3459125 RepID=UPI00403AF6EE
MKFKSSPVEAHREVPLADNGQLERVIDVWKKQDHHRASSVNKNQCYILSIVTESTANKNNKLSEILGLVSSLGDDVVGQQTYQLKRANPKTLVGQGVLVEVAIEAKNKGANLLVVDAPLSPSQMRNIEFLTGLSISDREAIILNVFMSHAKTRAAKSQVEIAQLEYLRPRIRGIGLNMDQQTGGINCGKGAGETASELIARQMDKRLLILKKYLRQQKQAGKNQRKSRIKCKKVALVGYTNAGKTSLMNSLTNTNLSAKNLPFETLDTTTRRLKNDRGGHLLLSDTVGFIRDLPEKLLVSFESTLAEILEANLLLIVVDLSDDECKMHMQTVESMLAKLNADKKTRLYILNKSDQFEFPVDESDSQEQPCLRKKTIDTHAADLLSIVGNHPYVIVSTHSKADIKRLGDVIVSKAYSTLKVKKIFVPHHNTKAISMIFSGSKVLSADSSELGTLFIIEASKATIKRIMNFLSR